VDKTITWASGYAHIWKPGYHRPRFGKRARRADIVLEDKLGRQLKSNELSHHKDGNRANDSPDNLEVKDISQHGREHRLADMPVTVQRRDGVYWNSGSRKFVVCVSVGGKRYNLGCFTNKESALQMRERARKEHPAGILKELESL